MLLSIVIPTYNRESVLTNTLSSIFSHTLLNNDYEVIVVDDGSTDKTINVVKEYAFKQNIKIRIFTQENKGPLLARYLGTQNAKGKYIWYIDSGDEICDGALDIVLNELKNEKADIYLVNYINVDVKGNTQYIKIKQSESIGTFFDGYYPFSLWLKISKKDLLLYTYEKIKKENLIIGEDMCQSFEMVITNPTISKIDHYCYKYLHEANSLTSGCDDSSFVNAIKYINNRINEMNIDIKEKFEYFAYSQLIVQYLLLRNNRKHYKEFYNMYRSLHIGNNKYIKYRYLTIILVKIKKYIPIKEEYITNFYIRIIRSIYKNKKNNSITY